MALSVKKHNGTARKAAAVEPAGEKRLVADVPEHIHKQVRLRCLERDVLVRDYLLELLARDGIR
jgi:hypothetical protein